MLTVDYDLGFKSLSVVEQPGPEWRSVAQLQALWAMSRPGTQQKAERLVDKGILETRKFSIDAHWKSFYRLTELTGDDNG